MEDLRRLLENVKEGHIPVGEALEKLKELPYKDIGIAKVDHHRELRNGYPEVIYCQGKKIEHIQQIVCAMLERGSNILATRADREMFNAVKELSEDAEYHEVARIITIKRRTATCPDSFIAVVTGGTSDIPVAEEAAVTAEMLGNRVERVYDVGVAGLHRLLGNLDKITQAKVIICRCRCGRCSCKCFGRVG